MRRDEAQARAEEEEKAQRAALAVSTTSFNLIGQSTRGNLNNNKAPLCTTHRCRAKPDSGLWNRDYIVI